MRSAFFLRTLVWVPACDAYGIVACRDAGMTKLRESDPGMKRL
jgi:hypothetical protein